MAVEIGRPAVGSMSATRKSSQPELSPRGAEMRRRAVPLKSSPAATPVWRRRRSMRPWGEASRPPFARERPRVTWSKSSPGSQTRTRSCQDDAPLAAARSRSAPSPVAVSSEVAGL